MGEKEQGTAQRVTAPRDVMTGQSSGRSIPENSIAEGGVDPDSPLESTVKSSKSNSSERQGAGVLSPDTDQPSDLDDDGDGALDEGPVFVLKNKTKSNQSNDRLGQEDDPDGADAAETGPIRIDSTPARGASDASAGGGKDG